MFAFMAEINTPMGESSKFIKSWTFKIQILKHGVCLHSVNNFNFNWPIVSRQTVYEQANLL